MINIKRGDIVMIKCDGSGNLQRGLRPAVILQNDIGNKFSPTTIIVPLTSEMKKLNQPTHEIISINDATGLTVDSMALCEQIITVNKTSIKRTIGRISNKDVMENISKACSISLALVL